MRSTRSHTADRAIGSASIVNPGLTPVPSTATFAFLAAASIRDASRRLRGAGYAASSVVVTMGTRRFSTSSNCGRTALSDELVQSTATSGVTALMVRADVRRHRDAQRPSRLDHVADVATNLLRIDVHAPDDAEALSGGNLTRDERANRTQPHVHHANHGRDYR